jgi:hypothetical protein
LEIRYHDLFCLLFIMLFQPHDLEIMLNELTRVVFCAIFKCFFFNFIIQHWIGWELS